MIARKLLLSAFALLTLAFVGCKDEDPEFVALNVETKTIIEGEQYRFYVESYQGSIAWSIDSEEVATINQTGVVTGMNAGTTNVRARLSNGTNLMAVLTVVGAKLEIDSISVALESLQLAPNRTYKFTVDIVKEEYTDATKYPLHVTVDKVPTESEVSGEIVNPAYVKEIIKHDKPTGYDVVLDAGSEKAEYLCKVAIGSFTHEFPLVVDYGVYLSVSKIEPEVTLDDMATSKPHIVELGQTIEDKFFCYLDGASDEQKAKVKEILLDKEMYLHDDLNVEIGDIKLDDTNDVWEVIIPIKAATKVYERGLVTLSIEDKTLTYDITCDDGKHFNSLYIGFGEIPDWSLEQKRTKRILEASYLKYIGGDDKSDSDVETDNEETEGEETEEDPYAGKERFKIVVSYILDPDWRADFINWNLNIPTGENAPIIYIGQQKGANPKEYEFEFVVNAAGSAMVQFSIENPEADDPLLTEKDKAEAELYRYQTVTARINVIDRNTVDVEEVGFLDGPDPLEANIITEPVTTSSSTFPLYTYYVPEDAATVWPAEFEIVEMQDGAEATISEPKVDILTGELETQNLIISHAGTIKVKAQSADKEAYLEVIAKLKINNIEGSEMLTLSTSKREYAPGETDKVTATLNASYKVRPDEYAWTSSNPDIIEVDNNGNITAKADGTATITATISDGETTATATITKTVRTVNTSVDFGAEQFNDYKVIKLVFADDEDNNLAELGRYYIDVIETSSMSYALELNKNLEGNGVYSVAAEEAAKNFTGTITFPSKDVYNITGGTITIEDGKWIFNLEITSTEGKEAKGSVTGTLDFYVDNL